MKPDIKQFASDPLAFINALVVPSAHGPSTFADIMAPHQRAWFEAIVPSMLAVARSEQPPIGRFWSERTKGASKDSDCACVLLWLLAFCVSKLDMVVGAADKDQANEMKKAAADILRLNPWLAQRVIAQSWELVCKATGSTCTILATDVAGSHGARPDITVMNELSHVGKEEFAQNLLDNASKKPRGLVIVATNAGFQGSWQETWRKMARNSERWDFHSYCEPAPWLSEAEVEEARQRNSKNRFNRLYWGDWVSQSGDALDDDDIKASINPNLSPGVRRQGDFYVAGLDLGVKQDHSALVILAGSESTLQLRLVFAQAWKPLANTGKVDLIAVERAIIDAHRLYKFAVVGYDPYQAALMAQRCTALGVPMQEMTFASSNLNLMASTLLDVFRSRRLELYDHPALIADLGRLTIEEKSYGHRLSATRNESGHADLATALAIALPLAVDRAGKPAFVIRPMFGPGSTGYSPGTHPFAEWQQRLEEHRLDQEYGNYLMNRDDELEDMKRYMRRVGRLTRPESDFEKLRDLSRNL